MMTTTFLKVDFGDKLAVSFLQFMLSVHSNSGLVNTIVGSGSYRLVYFGSHNLRTRHVGKAAITHKHVSRDIGSENAQNMWMTDIWPNTLFKNSSTLSWNVHQQRQLKFSDHLTFVANLRNFF